MTLKRAAGRSDFKRALHRRVETAPDRDVERQIARLHGNTRESGLSEDAMNALLGGE